MGASDGAGNLSDGSALGDAGLIVAGMDSAGRGIEIRIDKRECCWGFPQENYLEGIKNMLTCIRNQRCFNALISGMSCSKNHKQSAWSK